LASGAVTSVTRTNSPITDIWSVEDGYSWEGMKKGTHINFIKYLADDDFTQTVGIKVLRGRDINTKQYATDSTALLLTQSAATQMQLKDPIGKLIRSGEITWHVVGVIADFIPGLPYDPFRPIVLQGPTEDWFGTITFRMTEHNEEKMNKVAEVFREYNPDYPFESYYLKDAYNQRFRNEEDTGKLAAVFAGLTIFISCLGLFALATYMAESRVKEIGVRKVLGASATAIVTLLSRGFFTLIGIAFLVAMPIAWWIMNSWLQHYSYRISISWWIFVVTGLAALLITVLSVSYQAIRAALSNPVKALRSE
jgi:ABC-type antimicrobial peptide transport system permease subunit